MLQHAQGPRAIEVFFMLRERKVFGHTALDIVTNFV